MTQVLPIVPQLPGALCPAAHTAGVGQRATRRPPRLRILPAVRGNSPAEIGPFGVRPAGGGGDVPGPLPEGGVARPAPRGLPLGLFAPERALRRPEGIKTATSGLPITRGNVSGETPAGPVYLRRRAGWIDNDPT
jgi:hypothetical protein